MTKRLLSLLLACTILLSGAIATQAQPIKVACMGNSITAGAGINDAADRYPAQLQTLLGDAYEVRNFGQNSQTVQMRGYDLTEGSKPGDCAYRTKDTYKNALAYKPDIVVLKLGTNDSKNINWLEDSPEVFRNDLCDMLDEITSNSNPKIYMCYPLRVKSESWTINERNIHTIISIIKSVAEERGLPIINLHTAFEEELGDAWNTVYADGVHPNAQGAAIMARRISDAILNGNGGDSDDYKHLTIGCIGGMRTYGPQLTDRNTQTYCAVLSRMLGDRYTVNNYGVGNRTILRSGTENDPEKNPSDTRPCCYLDNGTFQTVLNARPDIVTIDLGEMDAKPWNWAHKADFERDVTEMVTRIQESNPTVKIYLCIPPRLRNNVNDSNIDGMIYANEVVPALRAIAASLNLDIIDMADLLEDDSALYLGNYFLSIAGHKKVAQAFYTAITGIELRGPIRVACVGNSITAGSGITDNALKYPAQLQEILGDDYDVRNYGLSGRTAQSRPAESYMACQQYKDALAFNPEIVVIKLGTNDSKPENWLEDSPELYTADMQKIIDSFLDLESKPKIYLCLPLRVIKPDFGINEKNIHKIIPLIYALGEKNNLPVINLHTAMEEELGEEWETAYVDGVHPNGTGAGIMARRIADALLNGNYGSDHVTHPMRTTPLISCMGGMRLCAGVNAGEYYTDVLQELYGSNAKITNAGIGNRTILRKGTEDGTAAKACAYFDNNQFKTKVLDIAPDIVTIDLGEKDTSEWNWIYKDELESDLTEIVDAIKESNASVKIYICLPTRTKNDQNVSTQIRGAVLRDEVIPALRDIAAKLSLPVIDISDVVAPDQYLGDLYRYNADGHRAVANTIYSALTDDDTTTGIADNNSDVSTPSSLTPNPVRSGNTVTLSGSEIQHACIDIYNVAGSSVMTATITPDSRSFTVNLPAGYYVWSLQSNSGIHASGKLIVK